ncbi:hypothetical protein A3L12_03235 [Thermococcus sp. P6]|uniref:prenyltransferase/squalene oxidase repeat-containing protein n=1 Tax=Thermococcus sp. P6 TaxID=122420 RepID=UPI000B599193|nr:prenyltransferase/squalene oxidase repeat-containing protein [Thermococcus sp. P6]ASJ10382.1 hypothetical protein A3L12_03235 [Thermococcus sp. P6]
MKRLLALAIMVLMVIPVVSAGTVDGSVRFLKGMAGSTQQTREISLMIMALSTAENENLDLSSEVDDLVNRLIGYQNPDGGWGFYPGEVSSVVDTSYAIIALRRAYPHLPAPEVGAVRSAIEEGISYLLSAENEAGWGYVPGTPSYCYPTLMAVWALGENRYSYNSRPVRVALRYLENTTCEIPDHEALALRLIAYHSVGYGVSNETLERVRELLFNGELSMKERAMLTYGLLLNDPMDFETAKAVMMLESYAQRSGNLVYWTSEPVFFSSTEPIATTAYALMAISTNVEIRPVEEVKNPYELPCDELKNLQNPDGGWGLKPNDPSSEKATYYALLSLEACYPEKGSVEKALSWAREAFERDAEWMRENHRMSVGYYYALKTLLKYDNLTPEEMKEAEDLIREVQLYHGLWGSRIFGPQPYDTALAVDALLDLGVSPEDPLVQRARDWLLGVSDGGWGTMITNHYYSYMLEPDVLTTLTVLEVLGRIATAEELKPHIEWLVGQRVDGGWPYMKTMGEPRVELTVRATDLLLNYGYDYTNETLKFVMDARDGGSIKGKTIELASAIEYLSRYRFVPPVTLYDVRTLLDVKMFRVIGPGMDNESLEEVVEALNNLFSGGFVRVNITSIGEDSYIVMANFGEYDVGAYNPYVGFHLENGTVTVGNVTVPTNESVILVPGKTAGGVVLFVLYEPENVEIAREIFTSSFIRYIRGNAMVFRIERGRVKVTTVG